MNNFAKAIVGIPVAASFAVWAYAYSGLADRPTPDELDDSAFAVTAEPVCAESMDALEQLPNAEVANDNVERAGQIRARNTVLLDMVDQLRSEVTGTDRDIEMLTEWLDDWTTYIDDRADYADRFELDGNEVFYVSAVGGERLERRITRFANTNRTYSCVTPTDVG